MQAIRGIWNFISNIGVTNDLDKYLAGRIKLCNRIIFVMLVCSVSYVPLILLIAPSLKLLLIVAIALNILPLVFNGLQLHRLGRIAGAAMLSASNLVTVVAYLPPNLPIPDYIYCFMLVSCVLPMVFFDVRETKWTLASLAINIALIIVMQCSVGAYFLGTDIKVMTSDMFSIIMFVTCIVLLVSFLWLMRRSTEEIMQERDSLMANVEQMNKGLELEVKRRTIQLEDSLKNVQSVEEELRQNIEEMQITQAHNNLLNSIIDQTTDAIQASSEDGRFIYMNAVAASRFGIRPEDASQYFVKDLEAIFKEEGSWEAHVQELKEIKTLTIESANTNQATGETFYVEVSVRYIVIEGRGYMIATSRNITERKKTQEKILAQEAQIRRVVNALPSCVFESVLDVQTGSFKMYFINEAVTRIFGVSEEEALTDVNNLINKMCKGEYERFGTAMSKALETMSPFSITYQIQKSKNEKLWVSSYNVLQTLPDGNIRLTTVVTDITAAVEAEQAIKEQNEQLASSEEELKQNLEELQATQEKLGEIYAEVQEKEAQISRIVNMLPNCVLEMEVDTQTRAIDVLFVNNAVKNVYGISPEFALKNPNSIFGMVRNRQLVHSRVSDVISSMKPSFMTYDIQRPDGSIAWLSSYGVPEWKSNGKIRYTSVVTDITEARTAEQEIRQLSLVASKTSNAVVITDNKGLITWVNDSFERITGYKAEEAIGKKPGALLQGKDTNPEHVQRIREGLARKKSFIQEILNYTKDGVPYWLELNITPVLDENGDVLQFLGVETDITERKNAETKLKELSLVASKTSNAVVITDNKGLITWVNDSFERITGYKAEEAIGKKPGALLQGKDTNPEHVQRIREGLARKKSFIQEILNYTKDGVPYWLELNITPVLDENGDVLQFLGVETDITDRVRREREIVLMNENLQTSEEELKQNLEELQATQDRLLELSFEQEKFVSLVKYTHSFIAIADMKGQIVFLNEMAKQMSGYGENYMQTHISDYHDAVHADVAQNEIIPTVLSEGLWRGQHQIIHHKTKQEYITNATVFLIKDPQTQRPIALASVQEDITERLLYEREVKKKNRDLAANEAVLRQKINQLSLAQTLMEEQALRIKDQNENLLASEEELKQNLEELNAAQETLSNQKIKLEIQSSFQKAILDNAEAIIITTNTEGVITGLNRKAEELLGYKEAELKDKQSLAIVHDLQEIVARAPEISALVGYEVPLGFEVLVAKSRLNLPNVGEWTFIRKSGERFPVSLAVSAMRDETGHITGFLGISQDISQAKAQEKELRQSNERLLMLQQEEKDATAFFRALFEGSSNPHMLVFPGQGILDCNTALIEILRYPSKEALIGLTPDKLSPEYQDDGTLSAAMITVHQKILKEKGFVRFDWQQLRADGTLVWVNVALSKVYVKAKPAILAVWHDLTEIKEKELALQEANKELAGTLKHLSEAQDQLIQSEKMATLGQLVASIAHEINTPLGAIRSSSSNINNALERILPSLPPFLQDLTENEADMFKKILLLSASYTDLLSTREQRSVKYELIEVLEKWELQEAESMADMLVELGIYKHLPEFEDLCKSSKATEFFENAIHFSTLVRSNKTISVASDKASKIVFALKNFSRQDQTGIKQLVNINLSLETTLSLYHHQIKQNIEVIREFGNIPEIDAYPDELVQVWTNLVHNAIQAIKGKGRLFVKTECNDSFLTVSIGDTGTGIPENIREKVFNPFFTTKKAGEGSGLGLDIVKKIIEKHDGRIYFESEINVGTTFFVEIPFQ